MTKTHKFKFGKLVRDKIPDLLVKKEMKVNCYSLESEGYLEALKEKLVEEAKEVLESKNKKDLCEELGDIMEVIYSLYEAIGFEYGPIQKQSAKF